MSNARTSSKHVQACSYCRRRKVKCDGGQTCNNCVNHGKICFYPPSLRGKRSRDHPKVSVEDRLSRLETLMQAANHETSRAPSILAIDGRTPSSTGQFQIPHESSQSSTYAHCEQSSGVLLDAPVQQLVAPLSKSTVISARALSAPYKASSAPSEPRIWEHHGPGSWCTLCSEAGVNWVRQRTGQADFAKTAQKLTTAWNRPRFFKTSMNGPAHDELDAETAWAYCAAYFDNSFEAVMGIVHRPDFEARLRNHFEQGAPTCGGDVAWYALRNIVYAAGCRQLLLEDDSITFTDAQGQSSRYFENVLSVHTELVYGPSGLDAVRALVALAFYAEATANEAFEYMVCATAVRLAQAKGLHRQPSKMLNLPETEVMHRNWLFWAIYCCEKQISYRSGRPSAIDDDNISCEIPKHAPPGSTIDVQQFTHMIKLALLSQKIAQQLGSVSAFRQDPMTLMKSADELHGELEAWKAGIKEFPSPGKLARIDPQRPNCRLLHTVYLQYCYYTAVQSIYAIFSSPWLSGILGMEKNPFYQNTAIVKANMVADAARNLIIVTRSAKLDTSMPQWASFYFPMSGLINLFIHVLNNPSLPSTQADLALLDIAAAHFSHVEFLTSFDIGSSFARELVRIARSIVENYHHRIPTNIASPMSNVGEQIVPARPETTQFVPFQPEDFDNNGWDIYSEFLMDELSIATTS